jgi:hypothetical protein
VVANTTPRATQESGRPVAHLTQGAISLSHTVAIGKGPASAVVRGSSMEKREWSDLFTADLAVADPEIARLIADQERQNRATVNLVASETYCPAATLAAETSGLVNKNAGGYPAARVIQRRRDHGRGRAACH